MVVTGLYWVVRRAYTVASCDALSWLVHGGCTACYVISVPLVLCSSLFGTLVFLGVLFHSIVFHCIPFYSIVFHSILFDLNSATVYVSILIYSALIQLNVFHFHSEGVVFGVIPCLYHRLYATPRSLHGG